MKYRYSSHTFFKLSTFFMGNEVPVKDAVRSIVLLEVRTAKKWVALLASGFCSGLQKFHYQHCLTTATPMYDYY